MNNEEENSDYVSRQKQLRNPDSHLDEFLYRHLLSYINRNLPKQHGSYRLVFEFKFDADSVSPMIQRPYIENK